MELSGHPYIHLLALVKAHHCMFSVYSKWLSTRLIFSNNSYTFLATITSTCIAIKLSFNWAILS